MAGAFGYEKEHYSFSKKVGEFALFPAIRKELGVNPQVIIAASGVSCQAQIQDEIGQKAVHPAELVKRNLAHARDQ
jgi:Fe-S oxidoreductase